MLTRLSLTLALALPLLLAGCADGLATDPPSDPPSATTKVRHASLMAGAPRIKVSHLPGNASARFSDDDETYVGLIVSLDPYRLVERYGEMDPFRLVERYRLVNRYRLVERYEYEHVFTGMSMWVAEGDLDALIADMEEDAAVRWIEPDIEMSLSPLGITASNGDASETLPWSVAQIGAGMGAAPNVDLYVADTGISSDDINERGGRDFSIDAGTSSASRDRDGHGTHIAGIAAASANGDGIRGIAPGMAVYDLRVLTGQEADDDAPVDLSSAIAAVEYATGAKLANPSRPAVLNFSLGTDIGTMTYNALDDAVDAAAEAGVVVVVAAGNSSVNVSTISPAHARGAITVGAYDQHMRFAPFSNHGAGIDILAPGVDIVSSGSEGASGGDDVVLMSGTSMAAGHVSGAAALFLQANPQATPAQVADALIASAQLTATDVPSGTTTGTLWVGSGNDLANRIPPFFDYAAYSGGKLEIKGQAQITAPEGNASVFAQQLKAGSSESRVLGFGYYTEDVSDDAGAVFRPRVNPTGLASVRQVAPLAFDANRLSVAALAGRATRYTDGDLELVGNVDLGTADAPVIWHVTGKLKIASTVQVSGVGAFLVEEEVQIKEDITTGTGAALAILTDKDITVDSEYVRLPGTFFAQGTIQVKGNAQITGSLTAIEEIVIDENVTLVKTPLAPALARALFGN